MDLGSRRRGLQLQLKMTLPNSRTAAAFRVGTATQQNPTLLFDAIFEGQLKSGTFFPSSSTHSSAPSTTRLPPHLSTTTTATFQPAPSNVATPRRDSTRPNSW